MKKYRVQTSLNLIDQMIIALDMSQSHMSLDNKLRWLARAKLLAETVYNTMRSLHD